MSNGLSQAEIDALLQGNAGESGAESKGSPDEQDKNIEKQKTEAPAAPAAATAAGEEPPAEQAKQPEPAAQDKDPEQLSTQENDAMGEIGNISMGTSATTLSSIVNRRVDITTPRVSVTSMKRIAREHPLPFVAVQVQFTQGLEGTNILFMKVEDVKIITDLMMGGDGTNTADTELGELHLSAISEVMNQMVGSSSTSLSKLIDMTIDISPPHAYAINLAEEATQAPFSDDEPLVRTSFTMDIEDLIHSEIMQIMPVTFARKMVDGLLGGGAIAAVHVDVPTHEEVVQTAQKPAQKAGPAPQAKPAPPPPRPGAAAQPTVTSPAQLVDVRPAQFDSFGQDADDIQGFGENMGLLMDVPLSVSVELGKRNKYIKEILDFNVGSIIVLDKMAGDMVDVVVNGKLIAKAEVVVIDDNYGARITDIITPAKRISNL